eukprot:CAMPEP_0201716306 /NCGR_PEP_ID=MMETSP0593-20130828/2324_1 /ASSEMBLY_ACC=CAM_ASM_000672 /TAXON_ID=267983 /ORGANISM="Skeletonema japonicum, Strain CCMP2506" /LENGTH=421 /DNA_ID=CAMNT_0048206091 /DNA_START=28 /DNA_END=1289 /DNA_ORIENTATION=-
MMMEARACLLGLVAFLTCKEAVQFGDAFSLTTQPLKQHRQLDRTKNLAQNTQRQFHLYQSNDDNPTDAIGGELVTALARLDKQWELARSTNGKTKIGEWTVMDLKEASDSTTSPEIVYLLEPASGGAPSCVILFLGGAVLGQFPHIAYSTFLKRVAERTNAAVVAIPYEVGLDHFGIAQKAVSRMKSAVVECEDSRGYSSSLPKYAIGHSLGCKLHSIGVAATGIGEELAGVGFVSFNNFGFAETITMARSFANEMDLGGNTGFQGGGGGPAPFDALFDLASMAIGAVGLEFTPSPDDLDRIVKTKFNEDVLKKIRMFKFDDDDLDSSTRFLNCFEEGEEPVSVSNLPGTHLSPVFLKLGVDDLDLPEEARVMADAATGGFQNASFGNEEVLDTLVKEVSDWMLGKSPSSSSSSSSSSNTS